ncbi:MAG: hypothetical protein JWM05_932 [Acidimicrobiales bacterium]|nr:hypothetical protein [Acidimicrobiales bacterium]
MSDPQQPTSVISIKTKFFPLAFLLLLFKPRYSINGAPPAPAPWGVTEVPVPAGRYQVEVWLPYLFFQNMGRNGATVDVPAGGRVQVTWKSPWLVFLKGKVSVEGPAPAAPSAPPAPPTPGA